MKYINILLLSVATASFVTGKALGWALLTTSTYVHSFAY